MNQPTQLEIDYEIKRRLWQKELALCENNIQILLERKETVDKRLKILQAEKQRLIQNLK
jgi:hypothetical protein